MENEFEKALAIGKLFEACDFILNLPIRKPLSAKKLVEQIETRHPSFYELMVLTQGKRPPKGDWEFLARFTFWAMAEVRDEHPEIWEKLAKAIPYRPKPRFSNKDYLRKAMRDIDEIVKESGFPEDNKKKGGEAP
jgi:hypothetical protein